MNYPFIDFWHLYAPDKQFSNRYRACEQLWTAKSERDRSLIIRGLQNIPAERSPPQHRTKNPYFFLIDWQPPQPHWLSPKETGNLLAQQIPLAVCRNPITQRFGTVTKDEADIFALEVHHYM